MRMNPPAAVCDFTLDGDAFARQMAYMPIGYSLIRFSTKKQADGDSFRRQNGPTVAFCEKHVPSR